MERKKKIIFRVTDQEYKSIQQQAQARGMMVAPYLRDITAQDVRLSNLDKRMDDLSATIDKNSAILDEHSKTIDAMENAIRRGAFDEVQTLADL